MISYSITLICFAGGENVYPAEVEQFLHSHEAIKDVQVVGVPDSRVSWLNLSIETQF